MASKFIAAAKGVPCAATTAQGKRPSQRMSIDEMLASLNTLKEQGVKSIRLDGAGTLHAEGNVLMTTESQI